MVQRPLLLPCHLTVKRQAGPSERPTLRTWPLLTNGSVLRLINPREEEFILKTGIKIANMGQVEEDCTLNVSAVARTTLLSKRDQETIWSIACKQSDSPWSSPVVLIKKKDRSIRFCVNYRKVNSVTRKDAYLLPEDDTLDIGWG